MQVESYSSQDTHGYGMLVEMVFLKNYLKFYLRQKQIFLDSYLFND